MKIVKENLWNSKDNIILVTCNSYINSRGELVMGRGAALELKNKFPYLAGIFGNIVKDFCGHLGKYGVKLYAMNSQRSYGIFQVKYHFRADADLGLIKFSTFRLWELLNHEEYYNKTVSMNFPGIGYGHLKYEDVLPILKYLDNRVTLYLKG